MTILTLELTTNTTNYIRKANKKDLSMLVSRVFEEYNEEMQDKELSKKIKWSKELDKILANIKL